MSGLQRDLVPHLSGDREPAGDGSEVSRRDRRGPALEAETVRRQWDLGEWRDWSRTPRGSTNVSTFVDTDRGQFVVRVSNARKTEAGMATEVATLEHLRSRGFPAPAVVSTRSGDAWARVGPSLCLVTERIPGVYPDPNRVEDLQETARALAWFHQEARTLPDQARPALHSELPGLPEGPDMLDRVAAAVAGLLGAGERDRLHAAMRALVPRFNLAVLEVGAGEALNAMVTHGSLGYSAVLLADGRLSGVLDYERMANEVRTLDLSYMVRALTRLRGDDGALDADRSGVLLSAYHDVEPLSAAEVELLPAVLRVQRLLKVQGKAANLLRKMTTTAPNEKDAGKQLAVWELEVVRLHWLESHRVWDGPVRGQ